MERNKIWAISNTKTLFGNKFENYLNQKIKINYDSNEKSKLRFKNMVSHSDNQVEKIYFKWKKEFMKLRASR